MFERGREAAAAEPPANSFFLFFLFFFLVLFSGQVQFLPRSPIRVAIRVRTYRATEGLLRGL